MRALLGVLSLTLTLGGSHAAAQSPSVTALAWMSGCWQQRGGATLIEEQWTSPGGETLLGVSRTTRDGRLVEFEFMRIHLRDGELVLSPQPGGRPPIDFSARRVADREVAFENLAHDFPQRIVYRAIGTDSLAARAEAVRGTSWQGIDYAYARVPCPRGPQ